jgi:hypothetical protein
VLRKGYDPARRALDLRKELGAEPGALRLIPGNGVEKLLLGRREKRNGPHFSSARAFAKTSSEEMVWTSPLR